MFQEGDTPVLLLVNLSNDTPTEVSFATEAVSASDFFDDAWSYPLEGGKIKLNLKPNGSAVIRLRADLTKRN